MNGEGDHWSEAAEGWSRYWGSVARPAWEALVDAAGIAPGTRVLDVGCGSGEFLAFLAERGAIPLGCDPAPGMLAAAARRAPTAELRAGGFGALPWMPGEVDVVVAVNALSFAPDLDDALAEAARLVGPGGCVAVATWAEAALNDAGRLDAALARDDGEEPSPDDELRLPGGLGELLRASGLREVRDGVATGTWTAVDDDTLVTAILLGEDAAGIAARRDVVLDAARPLRAHDGSTTLRTAFRWAVGTAT